MYQQIISNPIWGPLGILISIFVALIIYFKQKQRKEFSYDIITNSPLVSVKEAVKGRIKILFDDKPVEDVRMIIIKLVNSGNIEIKKEDFSEPITIDFSGNATILSAEIIEEVPNNLKSSIESTQNRIVYSPILLNGGDSVKLKVLVSKFQHINCDGRIAGVKKIRNATEIKKKLRVVYPLVNVITSAVVAFTWFKFSHQIPDAIVPLISISLLSSVLTFKEMKRNKQT